MGQYTSYYKYQKYEKIGSGDWTPVYPNVYSIDGDGTMPLSAKTENDPACGYVPTGETQYRWVNLDPSTDYYCSGTTKYYKQQRQVSYDDGSTWENVVPAEYRWGSSAQTQSTDCGYSYMERWVNSGTTCSGTSGYDKYNVQVKQTSTDGGQTWTTTTDTRVGSLIEANSTDCGYVPPTPPTPSGSGDYLTFTALENGTFKLYKRSISYSLDSGSTWETLASNTDSPTVSAGNKIMWKLTNPILTEGGVGTFSSTGRFTVEGNAMSLLYGDDFSGKTNFGSHSYAFRRLFYGCTGVTSAENLVLPATTLSYSCYDGMFSGCTSLTTAPQLPATTLEDYCYYNMFQGCTSLTTAPQLPATTLTFFCYVNMFDGCTSLITAPQLPATTLADYCYVNMFQGCTSLTTIPSNMLPATALTSYCYYGMFAGCTSLTVAPELPATSFPNYPNVAVGCYDSMFAGCTSLTTAPQLPATNVYECESCYNAMFSGCTSLTTAPELPATILAYDCYRYMFAGCTSLTTAPELPATTLKEYCYFGMFSGCTSLNYIKCLATYISARYCTVGWLYNVSPTGTFVKNSSMTDWSTGDSGIPSGWTVQNA